MATARAGAQVAPESETGCRTLVCALLAETSAPNDTPATAGAPLALPALVRGELSGATDVDCYALTVPAGGGALYAAVTDGAGGCPASADSLLTVYDGLGRVFERNDDAAPNRDGCSLIHHAASGLAARALPAGAFSVCVGAARGGAFEYHLSVALAAP